MRRGRRGYGAFAIALIALAASVPLLYRESVLGPPLAPLVSATTTAAVTVLRLVGYPVSAAGGAIAVPGGFALGIDFRCSGFLPVVCLVVGILAYPGPLRRKLSALGVGVPLLLALNLARLAHLFHVGVTRPQIFDVMHLVVWELAMMAAVGGLWLAYVVWPSAGAGGKAARQGRMRGLQGGLHAGSLE